ncbi:MAG: FtsX-like permease family protein [Myxococcota bacterium]
MSVVLLAWRNIWRSPTRTALTASAIAVALAIFVLMLAWVQGFIDYALESTTKSWSGMAQVHSTRWVETEESSSVLAEGPGLLARARRMPGILAAVPRAYGEAMAAMGDRTAAVQLVGIDLSEERRATDFDRKLSAGAWSTKLNHVLIGVKLADHLELGVGDKLALTAADTQTGELNDFLVRISGLLYTSNSFLDREAVICSLPLVQRLLSLGEDFHEITLQLDVPLDDENAITSTISPLNGSGRAVRAWQEIQRDLASTLEFQNRILWLAIIVVFLIAAFGIVNTMTMSFLERFREFGILKAIGTSPARLFGLIVSEAGWIGALGVGIGLVIASIAYVPLSIYGLTIGGAEAYGVSFDRNILFRVDVPQTVILTITFFTLTMMTGMLTARRAARVSPVDALRQG